MERLGDDPRREQRICVSWFSPDTMAAAHLQLIELHPNAVRRRATPCSGRDRLDKRLIRQALRAGEVDLVDACPIGSGIHSRMRSSGLRIRTSPLTNSNQPGIREFLIGSRSTAAWPGSAWSWSPIHWKASNNVLRVRHAHCGRVGGLGVDASARRSRLQHGGWCCLRRGRDQFFVGDVLPLVPPSPIAVTGNTLNRNLTSAALHFWRGWRRRIQAPQVGLARPLRCTSSSRKHR